MNHPTKSALDARWGGRAAVDALDVAPESPSPVPVKPGAAAAVTQTPAPPEEETPKK